MRRFLPLVAVPLLLAAPFSVSAQRTPEETLQRAVILYEELQLERAVVLLRQVISPSAAGRVSAEQRTQSHKYLGAAFALLRQRDSAIVHFETAVQADPFVDLDERSFTAVERQLFLESRRRTFALGVRPAPDTVIAPGTERIRWTIVTTQPATVQASLRPMDGRGDATLATLLSSANGVGVAEIAWDGLSSRGEIAPEGRFQIRFVARRDGIAATTDTVTLALDLRYRHQALEDVLPELRPEELLEERRAPSASRLQLAKGLGLAGAALAIPTFVGNGGLGSPGSQRTVMAGSAAAAGLTGFALWRRTPVITLNVAANERRRSDRALHNAEVRRRNAERLASARLVVRSEQGSPR
ncbi:MAG: hypothetical protein M3068_06275 [Gemmatimonadota bacterium]|nr:hypothetical protein [Gemmatimonadota bacterium]